MRIAAASVLSLLVFVVADAADAAPRPRLKAFDDCRSLVDYARSGAFGANVSKTGWKVSVTV